MNAYTFHITLYGLVSFGAIFIGLTLVVLLWSAKKVNQWANRFLALALATLILSAMWLLGIDIRLGAYFPRWSWMPLQFSMALGPLIYFYVLKITRPEYKFWWKDLLHLIPVLLQQGILILEITESADTGVATYNTLIFHQTSQAVHIAAFISGAAYLFLSFRLIDSFYQRMKFNDLSDRYRHELQWLHRRLTIFSLLWLLWVPYTIIDHVYYHHPSGAHTYYSWHIILLIMMIRITSIAFLGPEVGVQVQTPVVPKLSAPAALKQKATWLKRTMEQNMFYRDGDLSLTSLAEKLNLTPHELSRMINTVLKKSFADFINEYRVAEVARRMQDPAYDHITLLGIAYESGFSSKTTFNRAFKQFTGLDPSEYKNELKKGGSFYKMGRYPGFLAAISNHETTGKWFYQKLKRSIMLKNNFKIAWRNLAKNGVSSFINIGGLAVGMAVAILIGLWIHDELSFNKSFENYDRIAQVMTKWKQADGARTSQPMGLGIALQTAYKHDFKKIVLSTQTEDHVIAYGDKKFKQSGKFIQPDAGDMFSLKMVKGSRAGLADPSSILIGESLARKLFGDTDPINKALRMDNKLNVKVTGVYEDFPQNTEFYEVSFFSPWELYVGGNSWIENKKADWSNNWVKIFVQLAPNVDLDKVSADISNLKNGHVGPEEAAAKPSVFLNPMSKWHLYSQFGAAGERVESEALRSVWFYGIIGMFVLLLACINFMNLSTARSEKRAKEVGIRKAVGSVRGQLVVQFFSESLLVAACSFLLAIGLVVIILPWFNGVSGKTLSVLWGNPLFWISGIAFTFFTGLIAGSYPALYLSSFNPVKVLKGTFRAGRFAAIPRKVLVTIQFTVSIILIIGTIIVYRQIQFAKDRPVGYTREGLLAIPMATPDFQGKYDVLGQELKNTGAVTEIAESASQITGIDFGNGGFNWQGKDVSFKDQFGTLSVTYEYGKTIGWKFADGRDFSKSADADSAGLVINEAAAKYMGLKNPIGQTITWDRYKAKSFKIIGVIKDMVMNSPFEPAYPTIFFLSPDDAKNWIFIKLNPKMSTASALPKIEGVFKTLIPAAPFEFKFVDDDYAAKFAAEERIEKLAGFFAVLAILISCLGLFGLASFVAEQRTKEIGVRKILGASVTDLWGMLSKDFVLLVAASFVIAAPVAFYFMYNWLQKYQYRTALSWWIFVVAGAGALLVTLVTVSFQAIKAAVANPVRSLRSE